MLRFIDQGHHKTESPAPIYCCPGKRYLMYKSQTHCKCCTKISEVKLSAFIYRLFHEGFFLIVGTNTVYLFLRLRRNLHETVCKQVQIN